MKKHSRYSLFAGLALLAVPLALLAATLTWQARVQDSTGVEVQGPVEMGFRIYDQGGGVLWGETQTVTPHHGVVSAELGGITPIPESVLLNSELTLGITIAGDEEMAPRSPLVSTWKAMSAGRISGRAVQAGEGTLTVTDASEGSAAIVFTAPFTAPPVVSVGALRGAIGGQYFLVTRVADITAAGCTVHFSALGGSTATGSAAFDWIAIGE